MDHSRIEIGVFPRTLLGVTVDEEANDYLPHIFGPGAYVVIRKPADLPTQLPLLYARLTRS